MLEGGACSRMRVECGERIAGCRVVFFCFGVVGLDDCVGGARRDAVEGWLVKGGMRWLRTEEGCGLWLRADDGGANDGLLVKIRHDGEDGRWCRIGCCEADVEIPRIEAVADWMDVKEECIQ